MNQDAKSRHSKGKEKEEIDLNKEHNLLNRFFNFLTLICFAGTTYMVLNYENFWAERLIYKPENFVLPKLEDLYFTAYILPFIIASKLIFEKLFSGFMYSILAAKYKKIEDKENFNLGLIYKKKLTTNLYKVLYYTSISAFCYLMIRDSDFFPYELFGKGDMVNIFKNGDPGYLFFDKPSNFNLYYLINLAFVITDLIWLLFFYDSQSDFSLMILHHSITISLVTFSYLYNYSQIGVIVFFLHDLTDVFVYLIRIIINTDLIDAIKFTACGIFLFSYIFLRIYVFGKLIYVVGTLIQNWNMYAQILWYFKCILMIMHIYWVIQIINRFWHWTIIDVGKIKKKSE